MSLHPNDDYLERVKAEIRAEAEAARTRAPLPRIEPPPRAVAASAPASDGIERERLDYTLADLTGPDYLAFIDHVYRALLKRCPDDASASLQIRLLATGASKVEVLGNLRWSSEGRRIGTHVRGLLPRYALAKLTRVPVLGYFVAWGLTLAGLPMLVRHQRAMDTVNAARFNAAVDARREQESRFVAIEDRLAAPDDRLAKFDDRLATLAAAHESLAPALRDGIAELQRRFDEVTRHATLLEARINTLETRAGEDQRRAAAEAREIGALRHHVQTVNHWVASLQRSLAELEDSAAQEHARGDALAAAIAEDADSITARARYYREWSAALAAELPAGAQVLDLDSGDGAWLHALRTQGLDASGVELNAVLVDRALARALPVALGDPLAALERCADGSLDGLTLAADAQLTNSVHAASLLQAAWRVLRSGGMLMLRADVVPYRLDTQVVVPQRWAALLVAAGFAAPRILGHAVLARRAAG